MKLQLPEGEFEGYIFDCDGTLADTMPLHYQAWSRVLSEEGAEFSEELFYAWGGRPASEIITAINRRDGLKMSVEEIVARKESLFRSLQRGVQPIAAVVEIARNSRGLLPMAVASGGLREVVLETLDHLGIRDFFDVILGVEDYARGKPAPDPFLEAARRMSVQPERCLVFEDSVFGIEAARAAKMAWVLVPQHHE